MKRKATKPAVKPVNYLPPQLPEWKAEDAAATGAFLRTTAGQKLQAHMLCAIVAYNEWATTQPETAHACGRARGFKEHRDFILSLAAAQSSNTETPADTNGTAGALDHLRP
jgi:hypothetical protein